MCRRFEQRRPLRGKSSIRNTRETEPLEHSRAILASRKQYVGLDSAQPEFAACGLQFLRRGSRVREPSQVCVGGRHHDKPTAVQGVFFESLLERSDHFAIGAIAK